MTGPPSETVTGEFIVVRNTDFDLEEQRFERLRRALADKCPKLQRCKERGARTVLVLEDVDIPNSNSVVVREALNRAAGRTNRPPRRDLPGGDQGQHMAHVADEFSGPSRCFPRDFDIECKEIESAGLDDLMCKRNSSFQCDVCLGH